jgi:hypothetical protein
MLPADDCCGPGVAGDPSAAEVALLVWSPLDWLEDG